MKKKNPAQLDPRTDSELELAAEDLNVGEDLQVGEDLPAVSSAAATALEQIEKSQLGDRMKRALALVARGDSVRDAASAEDYSSHADVYRAARKYGLVDLRTKAIVETHRSVAKLSSGLLEQKLLDEPKTFSGPQLAVVSGIATDKVFASEKAATDDGSSYISALERMAERFAESGAGLELKVTLSPAAVAAGHVIDASGSLTK